MIRYITVRRTSSRQRNDNLLKNDQINDKRTISVLSEETLLESGKLFKKISKAEVRTHVLRAHLNVRTFGVRLHQNSRDTTREL